MPSAFFLGIKVLAPKMNARLKFRINVNFIVEEDK